MDVKKKAGCDTYASATQGSFTLYDKILKTGGAKKKKMVKKETKKPVKKGTKKPVKKETKKPVKKGGNIIEDVTNTVKSITSLSPSSTTPTDTKGGSSLSKSKSGGAVELAPFAASLAFFAARMAVDKELNFRKLLGLKKKDKKPVKKSRARSNA